MRIKGLIKVELTEEESAALSSQASEIVIPFQNMPMYPPETSLHICAESGKFYLEDLKISHYHGHTDRGTEVIVHRHGSVLKLLEQAIKFCQLNNYGKSASWYYRGTIDFSNC